MNEANNAAVARLRNAQHNKLFHLTGLPLAARACAALDLRQLSAGPVKIGRNVALPFVSIGDDLEFPMASPIP